MRRETKVRGASFSGTSDLTIVAPIRKGFVPALDAVTYKTRVQRVLKTLHVGRQTAHEYEFARVLSDAVERVGRIHSIRIAIIEPEDKVMLAVTFDGSWESYIRVIWQKVSRSLDLIFCNTEDYVTGWDHTFEEWCVWLRKSQAESSFLYSPPGLTYQDTQYLRIFERRHEVVLDPRDPEDLIKADLAATRISIPSAEDITKQLIKNGTDPSNLGLDTQVDEKEAGRPGFRQGVRALAGLYRLADVHMPGTPDNDRAILHRAACELLREFLPMITGEGRATYQEAIKFAEVRFFDAMNWLAEPSDFIRPIPCLPEAPDQSEFGDVQGGIIQSYPNVSDGCLLLLAFDEPQDLGAFLANVQVTRAITPVREGDITVNIALTMQGFRLIGYTDEEIDALPQEFVQGMERRAGMLGDVRVNHPRRWRLPALNWAQGVNATDVAEDDPCPRVDLSGVHLALQLRICNTTLSSEMARTRLWAKYGSLVGAIAPPRELSIQWMSHLPTAGGGTREHFGFLDGHSQPVLSAAEAGDSYSNQIHLGEILLGHANAADHAPHPASQSEIQRLLRNGSFLVIRKLRQDVGALEQALTSAAKDTSPEGATEDTIKEQRLDLLGRMVGRWPIGHPRAGQPLAEVSSGNLNDFSFDFDKEGVGCPLHAHIRRANPRDITEPEPPGARPARIIRRGMSYGPLATLDATDKQRADSLAQERGVVFMAYNASIGEQFEVIQRWLTGGNSAGSFSGQSDPLLGVAEPGRPRYFRFEKDNGTVRIALDGSNRMHDQPRPFVRLEWGMYLFTPAVSALSTLADRAKDYGKVFAKSWSDVKGEVEIAKLRDLERAQGEKAAFYAWKAAIEDPTSATEFTAASIWAAIRKNHGGVLTTPFGVLVASRELVDKVLHDSAHNLTATGYLPRMQRSFGQLYLGLDAGQTDLTYELESRDVNAAIMKLVAKHDDFMGAVTEAAFVTCDALKALVHQAVDQAVKQKETHWEVTFEAREIIDEVLAHFCQKWFGLSETGKHLKKSGVRWNWRPGEPPCYPGHFMAPSRYIFQPHPGPEVEQTGAEHGLALSRAITNYLEANGACLIAPVARAALDCEAARRDKTYAARTLTGVLMGFLPTTDGNMRRVMNEWLNDGTLWNLRAQYRTTDASDPAAQGALSKKLRNKFVEAMQLRAAPELLWRTAATSHVIGREKDAVDVRAGEMVIASLISATHECLEHGDSSLDYAFGGKRESTGGHPTHACPGYGPATAVMLGFFKGMVESDLALRPGPGALTLSMDGYINLKLPSASEVQARPARSGLYSVSEVQFLTKTIPLFAIGDSWLHRYLGLASSLTNELENLEYRCEETYAITGRQLATMAKPDILERVRLYLKNVPASRAPKAILLGGGGNDLVDPSPEKPRDSLLFGMLKKDGATSVDDALDRERLQVFIDGLRSHYRTILNVVTKATKVPIFIHAYDHPFADGRCTGHGQGPWLKPVFKEMNIVQPVSDGVMFLLIEELNKMVAEVALEYPGRVNHLKLSGELAKLDGFGADYTKYWANELHANDDGFAGLAQFIKVELGKAGVK